ncbi:MAG: hypothetical protein [Caudoviricetes sp.]|nr:MAG: hypothetical protein [Caudoviricetes sp.]
MEETLKQKKTIRSKPALHPVDWCIQKLEESLMDYNIDDMRNYLVALKMWRNREVCNA